MTSEEAILCLKGIKNIGHDIFTEQKDFQECLDMAIKALEQEPILDKIRAEIEKTTSRYTISRERGAMGQVEWSDRLIKESEVLEIIDKCKAESEEKK
jgi:hypothetical protein